MTTYVGNFDFEATLAGGRKLPASAYARMSRLAGLLLLLAEDDDTIATPGYQRPLIEGDGVPAVHWTDAPYDSDVRRWGDDTKKARDLVRKLNDKRTVAPLTPDATIVTTAAELPTDEHRYLLKPAFGGFGRGAKRYAADRPDETTEGWLAGLSKRGGAVCERLREIDREAATHLVARGDGTHVLGSTESIVDDSGQPVAVVATRGRSILPNAVLVKASVAIGGLVGSYLGPLSIDHAHCRLAGTTDEFAWRLVQEINARWTLGFLAFAASRRWVCDVAIALDATWQPGFDVTRCWQITGADGSPARVFFGR